MGYGFDLEEWASEQELSVWAANLKNQMGWQHMVWGRRRSGPNLDSVSNDLRPDGNPRDEFYDQASMEIQNSDDRPVIFERRFGYMRDNVWDDETMRRAMWQFTMAGGAAGWWGFRSGSDITAPGPFAAPETFRTHQSFWEERLLLEMDPHNEITGGNLAFALADDNLSDIVVYQEDTASIQLKLSRLSERILARAVDTKADYTEIPLGLLSNSDQVWNAPYESDWAIALGKIAVPSFAADFDEDGDVDGDDFLVWQASFGVNAGGDADDDGDTDGDDFLIWQGQFGSGSGAGSTAVPEPTSVLLLLSVAVVGMLPRLP
jgi:hypothetical protein